MSPKIPQALVKGDTIAIVSPSTRINHVVPWRLERATAVLERAGYNVKIIYDPHVPYSPLSANVAARAEEVHSAFRDPTVKAIICCIGGSTANELLPALDPEIIRNNPKILTGGSDNTLLHHFCYVNGLRTFYGPSAINHFGEWPEPLSFTWEHFFNVTTTTQQPVGQMPRSVEFTEEVADRKTEPERIRDGTIRARVMKPSTGWRWLQPGSEPVEGEIWGGCLPSLFQMMDTKWEVSYQGKIAFIETPKDYPLDIAICNFYNLRMRGIFDQIVGLVVGRPHGYSDADVQGWENGMIRALEGYDFPVLANVDVGHTDPVLTIPLGARVRLDSAQDLWEVLEPGVY
ncbi:hypothetical protein E8E14_007924 [Neopestalotiopsis sp. 37M]|nr:hypothetical protein E8E14_007924 [Neopestalotiopsis sp. 37M]